MEILALIAISLFLLFGVILILAIWIFGIVICCQLITMLVKLAFNKIKTSIVSRLRLHRIKKHCTV